MFLHRMVQRSYTFLFNENLPLNRIVFRRALASAVPKSSKSQILINTRLTLASSKTYGQRRQIFFTRILLGDVIEIEGPAFAESISEGDIRWIKKKGDFVREDEVVAEIETDKTAVEVPSPHSGTIVELLVADGSKVTAKQKLYKLELGDAPAEDVKQEKPVETVQKEESVTTTKPTESPSSPVESVSRTIPPQPRPISVSTSDASSLKGTIPSSMPPIPELPKKPISSIPTSEIKISPLKIPSGVSKESAITGIRNETRVKMNRMRLRIAQRLKEAQNTYAMLTTFNEIDMSSVIEMRSRYQKDFTAKHGIKLGLMSPFIRAAAYALQETPSVNAVIDEDEIIYRHYIDISIAVATPKGLVVPVLRDVQDMDYGTIELMLNDLGVKARDGKLAIEDMEGGTFTISNGGVFGSLFGTPIINPPQSSILGMHSIVDRPVAVNGKVEIRPMMIVALTYDHRLIDGREAVTFLRKIKTCVEDPRTILMNL